MKTKNLVLMSLFVGIGAVLHMVVPSGGMKPDFSLIMLFLGILLFPDKRSVLILGIATGIVSGLTTSFPGGQIPNIIDKFLTSFIFFGLYTLVKKGQSVFKNTVLTAIGTLISGTIFLTSALFIGELPASFLFLFSAFVLPATAVNSIVMFVLYPIILSIAKRTKMIEFA
ncbi:tryptophan transporter [Fervidibacillus halotolerans]|uniref:Tryptophan transporter n=1 Tax=Fervidibacillus halotolerans TaxID=2980027 RepID=A0A9E8M2A0_9BACI|nr:tryptophan transporter [Fervidibacillus halotolerans]WAA13014.1 tryptophan transporter [Fervidibacillus halotolerans]